jgi:hypothetical protein
MVWSDGVHGSELERSAAIHQDVDILAFRECGVYDFNRHLELYAGVQWVSSRL